RRHTRSKRDWSSDVCSSDPTVSSNDEGRLKPPFAGNAGIPLAGARRLKPCPRQSRHCESGLLEQMSTLYCYKVKASACSGNQRFVAHNQMGQQLAQLYIIRVGEIIEPCSTRTHTYHSII